MTEKKLPPAVERIRARARGRERQPDPLDLLPAGGLTTAQREQLLEALASVSYWYETSSADAAIIEVLRMFIEALPVVAGDNSDDGTSTATVR